MVIVFAWSVDTEKWKHWEATDVAYKIRHWKFGTELIIKVLRVLEKSVLCGFRAILLIQHLENQSRILVCDTEIRIRDLAQTWVLDCGSLGRGCHYGCTNGLTPRPEWNPWVLPQHKSLQKYNWMYCSSSLLFPAVPWLLCLPLPSCFMPWKRPALSRTVCLWGLVDEVLGSARGGGILPSPSTKGGQELPGRVPLLHVEVKNCPQKEFLICTEEKVCTVTRITIILLSWCGDYTHQVSQTAHLGGGIQLQELPSHIHRREELLLTAEETLSKLQNCFYCSVTQKENHHKKSIFMFLQRHAASLLESIFWPQLIQMTLHDTTWCGTSVFCTSVQNQHSTGDLFPAAGSSLHGILSSCKATYS